MDLLKTQITNKILLLFTLLFSVIIVSQAESKKINTEIQYTTEFQTDFGSRKNWVNLLSVQTDFDICSSGTFSIQPIAVYKTSKDRIIDDLQVFSNIESDNMPINLFYMGYTHHFKKIDLFVGLRNANHDYFNKTYAAFFTNSSSGAYPTLSANFPLANYPLSAMCLHGDITITDKITIKNSLYNGVARSLLDAGWSAFSVNPFSDGIMNITEFDYKLSTRLKGYYDIGIAFHTPYNKIVENKITRRSKVDYAIWTNIEQTVFKTETKEVGLLVQACLAPSDMNECSHYIGGGAILTGFLFPTKKDVFGIFTDLAKYADITEKATEISWKYSITDHLDIQPAVDFIFTGHQRHTVGLLRLYINIDIM